MTVASAPALALAAAFLSAGATIFIQKGFRGSDPYTGVWINVAVGTVGLWAAVLVTGAGQTSATGIALFAAAGLIGTVGGRLLRFVGIEKVGPSIAAALTNLHPLVAAALAILLLAERVTLPIVLGTAIVVVGTVTLSFGGGARGGFRPWHLAIPFGSAVCFGIVAVVRKLGLVHTGVVLGSAINVTTAMIAFSAFMLASGRLRGLRCDRRSFAWFVAAGLAENTSVFLNVVALGLGTVSVVSPLVGSSPIFVLFLSYVFLRGVERLGVRVIAGTLLTVVGVYLITLFQ